MMRVLWNEIKKILTWKMLLLLAVVNSILFFLLIEFHIEYFPNGRPGLDSYNIGVEMIEKYGTHMDELEFADFKKTYEAQLKEADQYLQSRQEFVDAGFDAYEKFTNYNGNNEVKNALRNKVFHEEQVDLFWEIQERYRLIEFHEIKETSVEAYRKDASLKQKIRFDEMIEKDHYQVYPEEATENFKQFIFPVAVTVIFSVVFMISPGLLKDRSRRMLDLQYTTKKGRNLYKTKVAAGFITTFAVITILLTIYFSFYSLNNTSPFFDVPMHMFIGGWYWYDPTFFQYIALSVIAIYVLGFFFAFLAMAFSSIMPNYISLIGIQIPFVIGMISYGLNKILIGMIDIGMSKWIVPAVYSVLIVASLVYILLLWKREKKRDIVN